MTKRQITALFTAFWTWLVFMPAPTVFAVDFSTSVNSVVTVESFDKPAKVTTTISVTNQTDAATPEAIDVAAIGKSITGLSAKYGDGTKITANYSEDNGLISLATTNSNKGKNKKWSIRVSYSSTVIAGLGDSNLVLIEGTGPGGEAVEIKSETRTLKLNLGLGVATQLGAKSPETTLGVGQQVLSWQENGPITYATGVMYGEKALAEVDIKTTLNNSGLWWKNFTVVLPPDTNQQRSVIASIEPKPRNLRVDVDGNILAEYRLGPRAKLEVTAKAYALVNNYTYALDQAEELTDKADISVLSDYLKSSNRWKATNVEIAEGATQLQKLNTILQTVRETTTLSSEDELTNSVTLNDALIGTLRANDIPARVLRGIISNEDGQTTRAWAEVFLSGLGWITVDASADTKTYKTADARYVALLIRGFDSNFPPSRIKDTSITYVDGDELPETEGEASLSTTIYMLFPGVGLRTSKVTLPAGAITDGLSLKYNGTPIVVNLGSLAPFQSVSIRDFLFAGEAFSSSTAELHAPIATDEEGEATILSTSTSTVSWLPFIVISSIFVVLLVVFVYVRRRLKRGLRVFGRGPKRPKKAKNTSKNIDKPTTKDRLPKIPTWRIKDKKSKPQKKEMPKLADNQTDTNLIVDEPEVPEPQYSPQPMNDTYKSELGKTANTLKLPPKPEPEPIKPDTDLSETKPEDNLTKRTKSDNSLVQ